jgi:hypothetical protein
MEGYNTPPSSFAKVQSTGSIFRSMNDTLQDVYSNMPVDNVDKATTKKRSRSLSPLIPPNEGTCMSLDDNDISLVEAIKVSRPMKPLRRPRHSLLETSSLPNGSLLFGSDHTPNHAATKTINEEDDWSNPKPDDEDFPVDQPFEPMVLY